MIESVPGVDWRDLQNRVAAILSECGMSTEVARTVRTVRGVVEVDVFATDPSTTPPSIYLVECKRWQTLVPKAEVKSFRTDVSDFGAHFGLFISARGFQSGAPQVVKHTNVHLLSWPAFQELFEERWCCRFWVPTVRDRCDNLLAEIDPPSGSDACVRLAHGDAITPAEAVGMLALDLWDPSFLGMLAAMGLPAQPFAPRIWRLQERYREFLPERAAAADTLREFMDALIETAENYGSR